MDRDGFLAIDRATSMPDAVRIRAIAERLVAARAGYREGALFDALGAADGDMPRFTQIINPHNYARELRDTEFARNALAMAQAILGPEARFSTDLLLVKPPRTGGATPWHQDEAFRDPAYDRHDVSIWLALQPVDETNGCMSFVAGSHRGPVLEHGLLGGDSRVHALECRGEFDEAGAVCCPLPMGGATLHQGRTLHQAGPNRSAAPRYAYVMIFDIPPTRVIGGRSFPWQDGWRTDRLARSKSWRLRGGFAVEVWRGVRKVGFRRPGLLLLSAGRLARKLMRRLDRNRQRPDR